jgi:stage II sporulation protein M
MPVLRKVTAFLKDYRRWLLASVVLFVTGLIIGLATPPSISNLLSEEVAALEEFAELLTPLPNLTIFLVILMRNVSAVLISLVLSPFLCLVPVIALVANGWLVGLVSIAVLQQKPFTYLLAGLLPHGIIELPALFIGEAIALSTGIAIIMAVFSSESRKKLLPRLGLNIRYLAFTWLSNLLLLLTLFIICWCLL